MSKKKDSVTFITRPGRTLVGRWEGLARQYKRESANQLMVEIAEMYTDMWIELEEARLNAHKQQWENMRRTLKLPLHPGETEVNTKPRAQGKKK